jgi:Radical SAM superfamily
MVPPAASPDMDPRERSWLQGNPTKLWGWRPEFFSESEIIAMVRQCLAQRELGIGPRTLDVYVSSPLCASKCRYCQYFSQPRQSVSHGALLTQTLISGLRRWRLELGHLRADNVYFGGGTPSLPEAEQLERLFSAFTDLFTVRGEFTFEANPRTLTPEKIDVAAGAGVGRISIGVQSTDPQVLARIGRPSVDLDHLGRLLSAQRSHGIFSNADLVFDLPGQAPSSVRTDVQRLTALQPDSITMYRFVSVPGIRRGNSPPMSYNELFRPRDLLTLLRRGYVPSQWEQADANFSFVRASRTTRKYLTRLIPSRIRGFVVPGATRFGYTCFDDAFSNLIGLGPGAFSRLFNHGWFRDVSSLTPPDSLRRAIYCGTTLTRPEQCHTAILRPLLQGRWHRLEVLERLCGAGATSDLRQALHSSAIQWRGGFFRLRRSLSEGEQTAFFRRIMPLPEEDERSIPQRVRAKGISLFGDLEPAILPDIDGPSGQIPALWAWLVAMELDGPEARFEKWVLVSAAKDLATFGSPEANASPEVFSVGWAGSNNATEASGAFALSLRIRPDVPVEQATADFFASLVAATANLVPPTSYRPPQSDGQNRQP